MNAGQLFSNYIVETWYSEKDGVYLARIQEVPDCITDGKTREDAIKELEKVFEGWLEIAVEDNLTIPKPKQANSAA